MKEDTQYIVRWPKIDIMSEIEAGDCSCFFYAVWSLAESRPHLAGGWVLGVVKSDEHLNISPENVTLGRHICIMNRWMYTVILIYTPTSNQNPDMNKRS